MRKFRTFLETNKIFYMIEKTLNGDTFIDMIIDQPDLRKLLLKEKYNSLDYSKGLKELTALDSYDNSKYMKPIVETIPIGLKRGSDCLRIVCDKHYGEKLNKVSHVIMNYYYNHPKQ